MTATDLPMPGLALVPRTDEKQTAKDFKTDQEVRWCPGCGDYAILAAVQGFLPELGLRKDNIVFVSGIGCSSRFPYYMDTYGVHSIHGRAPAIATGIAITRPDLSVWVVTGDGDALSIGGNHLIHALRRNVNLKILLFNNRIYGLTKGQYSPTSRPGTRSPSSPGGSIERNLNPCNFALAAGAREAGEAAQPVPAHRAARAVGVPRHQVVDARALALHVRLQRRVPQQVVGAQQLERAAHLAALEHAFLPHHRLEHRELRRADEDRQFARLREVDLGRQQRQRPDALVARARQRRRQHRDLPANSFGQTSTTCQIHHCVPITMGYLDPPVYCGLAAPSPTAHKCQPDF